MSLETSNALMAQYSQALSIDQNPIAASRLLAEVFTASREHYGAWFTQGNIYSKDSMPSAAVACYRRVLSAHPDEPYTLANLAWEFYKLGELSIAINTVQRALELNPNLALAHLTLSLCWMSHCNYEGAYTAACAAYALDNSDYQIRLSRSFSLLASGRLAEGLDAFSFRFATHAQDLTRMPIPQWTGSGGRVLIVAEQGLGDTLQFARFIPLAASRADHVIISCQRPLIPFFYEAFRDIPNIEFSPMPSAIPDGVTSFCPILSLPVALGLSSEEIRAVPAAYAAHIFESTPQSSRRVGICWAGDASQSNDANRSMPDPSPFLELYSVPGVELCNFQYGKRGYDAEPFGPLITGGISSCRDMLDTADRMTSLCAVVTVCTSVAHLAGALGLPCFVIPPFVGPHWIYTSADSSLWYPNFRVVRLEESGGWKAAMRKVSYRLTNLLEAGDGP
jgi:Tfp pilus assembly protein PilF